MKPSDLAKVICPFQQLMIYQMVDHGNGYVAGCQQMKAFEYVNAVEEAELEEFDVLRVDVAEGGETVVIVCKPEVWEDEEDEDSAE